MQGRQGIGHCAGQQGEEVARNDLAARVAVRQQAAQHGHAALRVLEQHGRARVRAARRGRRQGAQQALAPRSCRAGEELHHHLAAAELIEHVPGARPAQRPRKQAQGGQQPTGRQRKEQVAAFAAQGSN